MDVRNCDVEKDARALSLLVVVVCVEREGRLSEIVLRAQLLARFGAQRRRRLVNSGGGAARCQEAPLPSPAKGALR